MNGNTRRLLEATLNDEDLDFVDEPEFHQPKKHEDSASAQARRQKQKEWGRAMARAHREQRKAQHFEEHQH